MNNCAHNWLVVTEIVAAPWDDFMRFRGEKYEGTKYLSYPTHTLICEKCKEIKKVM